MFRNLLHSVLSFVIQIIALSFSPSASLDSVADLYLGHEKNTTNHLFIGGRHKYASNVFPLSTVKQYRNP